MTMCPTCGAATADDARFCSSCGTRVGRAGELREERKVVSVLFVDLVGFTASSDGADPEDVRDLLHAYLSSVKERIERFGGSVEKFIGDAVMAVFGAPVAHTDDAERAVRAGLRALEAVEELRRSRPGSSLSARAGVNTGEAIVNVGSGHDPHEAIALGDAVNTAARLQTAAPRGGLVVGEETYRATRDAIRYEALAPIRAKGKAAPLAAWLAVEPAAPPAERRLRGTPLVGRDRELSILDSVWDRATSERRPHLVTILGPPGIGKSRLSREFAALVERRGGRAILGRCLPYDTRDVYAAFAQQVRQVADVFEQDRPEAARAKLDERIAELVPAAERAEVVRSFSLMLGLGLDPPMGDQLLLFYAARRLVEGLGIERPTVLLFEDIHWADAGQLDLIEYVAGHAREAPIVFMAMARPELLDEHPRWGGGLPAHTTISLEPVGTDDAAAIVSRLVGDDLPEHSLSRLLDAAEGNPLFLEELTAALLEGADLGEKLPTTVRAAIAGRVDALAPEQRSVLLAASVVGKAFWVGSLRALGRGDGLESVLDALENKELIRRERSSRVRGDVEFSFKHQLIHDVCYGTLPRAERAAAHAAIARYVESVAGEQARELAGLLAHHWEAAGDATRAVEYLLIAADRAQEALAVDEAMTTLDHALELAADEATRLRVRLRHAFARVDFEDYEAAIPELDALLPELAGLDEVEVLLALSRAAHWTERTPVALDAAGRALQLAESISARELVPAAMARLSHAHAMRGAEGDLDRAIELGEGALRTWVPGARDADLAEHEHLLADQHYWVGSYQRALVHARAAREKAVDPGSAEALLRGGGMEGLVLTALGRYEDAIARFDTVVAVATELDRPLRVLLNYSAMAFRELFDLAEAERLSETSLEQRDPSETFHMPWMNAAVDLVQTHVLGGELGAARTRWDGLWDEVRATPAWERWLLGTKLAALRAEMALDAEGPAAGAEWAERAITMARAAGRAKYEAEAARILGRSLVRMRRAEDAIRELRGAVAIADALGSPFGRWRTRADLGRALEATGDHAGAAAALEAAAGIVATVAEGLGEDRRKRFVAAPAVADLLGAV